MNNSSYMLVLWFGVVLSAQLTMAMKGFEMELLMTKLDFLQDQLDEVEHTMTSAMDSSLKESEHRLQEKLTKHENNMNEKIATIEAKIRAIEGSLKKEHIVSGFKWVAAENGDVPYGAVKGGRTLQGETLYIGRVYHNGHLLPGKVHPSHQRIYVANFVSEHYYNKYEVLVEVRRGIRILS